MKKLATITALAVATALFALPGYATAQAVSVTATVQSNSGGEPYSLGTYQVNLVDAAGNPISVPGYQSSFAGSLSSAGALALSLFPNAQIQAGSKWKFQICSAQPATLSIPSPSPSPSCFSAAVTITGAGSISSTLNAAAAPFYGCTQWSGSAWISCGGSGTFNALTGDATSTATGGATTVVGINGVLLSGLSTGLLKITTGTGAPSIASPGTDYVIPSGNAATATNISTNGTANQVWGMNSGGTAQGWQNVASGGLSGMTAGQVPIAATATTVTSSKALAGSGAGISTGPTSSTSGDAATFSGTGGQLQDAGFAPAAAASADATFPTSGTLVCGTTYSNGASNLSSAVPTLPASGNCLISVTTAAGTATVTYGSAALTCNINGAQTTGQTSCVIPAYAVGAIKANSTTWTVTAWTTAQGSGGGGAYTLAGGANVSYSASPEYLPWMNQGGAVTSISTYAQPIATGTTLNNLYVQQSSAVAAGASVTYTITYGATPGAAAVTTVKCTVAAGATSCSDTADSVTVAAGGVIGMQITYTGTPGSTIISYGVKVQ